MDGMWTFANWSFYVFFTYLSTVLSGAMGRSALAAPRDEADGASCRDANGARWVQVALFHSPLISNFRTTKSLPIHAKYMQSFTCPKHHTKHRSKQNGKWLILDSKVEVQENEKNTAGFFWTELGRALSGALRLAQCPANLKLGGPLQREPKDV